MFRRRTTSLSRNQETGTEPNLSESLRDVGVEPQRALALAKTDEAKAALMKETDLARDLGIFGSPTFVVGRELFWGDDRLEDAISWYRYGSVRSMTLLDFPEPDSLGG
jgi:2-hydroxychromene-2-carboxylate isomerase